jgi:hypothetical protein
LLVVVCVDAVFALSLRLPMAFGREPWESFEGPVIVPAIVAVLLVPMVLHAAWRLLRQQHDERAQAPPQSSRPTYTSPSTFRPLRAWTPG